MQRIFKTFLFVALSTSVSFAANKAIPIQEGSWQLIGINGYHQNKDVQTNSTGAVDTQGACEVVACMDMGEKDIALISVKGSTNPTYDANFSFGNQDIPARIKDPNGYEANATWKIFTSDGKQSGRNVIWIENNGTTFGSAAHAVLGIHALNHGDTKLNRVAIAMQYNPSFVVKGTSPLKTMYIRSPSASSSLSMPDILVVYQSTLEGHPFKIMVSENKDFLRTEDSPRDLILVGKFTPATWDKPLYLDTKDENSPLQLVPDPGKSQDLNTTTTMYTNYRSIPSLFDANLTDNNGSISGYFDPLTAPYIQGLEGNLTVYEYTRLTADPTWRVAAYYGSGSRKPTALWPDLSRSIVIPDKDEDGISDFTQGMGYWVKYNQNAEAKVPADYANTNLNQRTIPGFLAGNSMKPSDYKADFIKEGWNLLAFDNSALRYTTTGLVLAGGQTKLNISSPEETQYIQLDGLEAGTDQAAVVTNCKKINQAIDAANKKSNANLITAVYPIKIRCYPVVVDATGFMMLVSNDKFGVDVEKDVAVDMFHSLAGADFKKFDANITVKDGNVTYTPDDPDLTHNRVWSRYGEYLMGVKLNPEAIKSGATLAPVFHFSVTIPALETRSAKSSVKVGFKETWEISSGQASSKDLNETIANWATTVNAPVSYNQDLYTRTAASAWLNADDNSTLYIGVNKRFYVTDDTFVRVYDLTDEVRYISEDQNGTGWGVRIVGDGEQHTDVFQPSFVEKSGMFDNLIYPAAGAAAPHTTPNSGVLMQVIGDKNQSVAFFDANISNFDVQEANVSKRENNGTWTPGSAEDVNKADYFSSFDILKDVDADVMQAREDKDKNDTILGAITSVYNGTDLSDSIIAAGGATEVATYRGISNLRNTPVYVESFPNNGPLYYLSALGLRPEVIMAAETGGAKDTGHVKIMWRAVDVTRNPSEWFDDATSFDLFSTEYGKGYWVYLSGGYDVANAISIDDNVKYKITGYHHFNNKRIGKYSRTSNHADGFVDAKIGGLYRTSAEGKTFTSGESYNVEAIVNGNKQAMGTETIVAPSGTTEFTLRLNDYETAGFKESANPALVDIFAADGIGARASKEGLKVPFVKPGDPVIEIDGGNIAVSSTNAKFLLMFENNISDTTYKDQVKLQIPMDLDAESGASKVTIDTTDPLFKNKFKYPEALDPELAPKDLEGAKGLADPTSDLRFIASTDDIKFVGSETPIFMSNQYHYKFAPIYSGTQILEVTKGNMDNTPYDTVEGKLLTENRGVVLLSNNFDVAMVYPSGVANVDLYTNASTIHTVKVGIDNSSPVAEIQFAESYTGKYFFMYVANKLYYSVFPNMVDSVVSGNGVGRVYKLTPIDGSEQVIKKPGGASATPAPATPAAGGGAAAPAAPGI